MADSTTRATQPPSTPPTGPAPPKQALYDAYSQVMRKQAEENEAVRRAAAEARRRSRIRISPVIAIALLTLLATGAYVWVEQPIWLFPPPPLVESEQTQEASLRIGMATAAQRIERFRLVKGRLPATLAEAGSAPTGIRYERQDDHYVIYGTNGPIALTLDSGEPLAKFVGTSFQTLARRSHRR
jgi:hypothetical protein